MNVEDLYKNIKSKKLLIHDFSDSIISYSIAEEILSNNNYIAHIKTSTFGHLHILRASQVHTKIIQYLEQGSS